MKKIISVFLLILIFLLNFYIIIPNVYAGDEIGNDNKDENYVDNIENIDLNENIESKDNTETDNNSEDIKQVIDDEKEIIQENSRETMRDSITKETVQENEQGLIDNNQEIEQKEMKIQEENKEEIQPSINYQVHIQNQGWQETKYDSNTAGTTGQNLRLEAIRINVTGLNENTSVKYQAHIQNIGWQSWRKDGEIAGTEGKSMRIEALKVCLESSDDFSVMYRAHVQNIGWQEWKTDGEIAGTEGKGYRIEAIEIKIVPKTKKAEICVETPGENASVFEHENIEVCGWKMANVANTKMKVFVDDNEIDENTIKYVQREDVINCIYGFGSSIENPTPGFKFDIGTANLVPGIHEIKIVVYHGDYEILKQTSFCINIKNIIGISYSSHVQNIGWQGYRQDGEKSGTEGKSYRLEAIKINLVNSPANGRIKYRTHIQDIGWQDWKSDNQISGTEGRSLRLEAIQIELENLEDYTVEYQVHIQDKGWSQWYIDGEVAGTVGQAKRLEAIRIRVVPKYKRKYFGIDVSKYNGKIDWKAVKNSGVDYVMVRVGFRGYGQAGNFALDSKFKENIEGAKKAGLKVGVYFVTQAINENEAIEEAKWVIDQIKGYKIDMPVVIDVEYSGEENHNGRADHLDKTTRTAIIKTFCKNIQNAGYTPMIYLNVDWAMNFVNMSQLTNYDTWIAHYRNNPDLGPSYSGHYTMWQYTSTGRVNGVSDDADCNICYKQY